MYGGRNLLELDQPELRRLRGGRYLDDLPGADDVVEPGVHGRFSVDRVLRLHLGLSPSDARKRALALLAEVGIPDPEFKITPIRRRCLAGSSSG